MATAGPERAYPRVAAGSQRAGEATAEDREALTCGDREAAIGLPIARVPKTRRTHVNESRIDGVESLPGKAPARQHLGTEVFHQRIAHADETLDDLQSFWTFGVETDGELSIV